MSTEEKCSKCNELKTTCKCDTGTKPTSTIQEIKVKVDTDGVKDILKRLSDTEAELKTANANLERERQEKKLVETNLDEEKTQKEKYESSLKLIGEQKLNEKRKIIMDTAKEVIKDPNQLKQIEDGIKDPDTLAATESLVNTFYTVLKQGEKEHTDQMAKEKSDMEKKLTEKDGGKGSIPMTAEMLAKEHGSSGGEDGYEAETLSEAHRLMIRDLRKKSHSDDPMVAAKAKSELEEMMAKWVVGVKKQYDGKAQGGLGEIGPKNVKEQPSLREITKKGGEAI
jgi:hypothetical protein